MKRFLGLLLIVVLLATPLASVPARAQGGGGTLIGAFDVGPGGCPQCIPYFDTAGRTWLAKIWSPLLSWNADISGLEPQLATSWSSNADASVWTFKLRDGVTWHDGEPLTADDVKFSLELAFNPETKASYPGFSAFSPKELDSVNVVDKSTVEFKLKGPKPLLPYSLTMLWILPKHALKDVKPADYQKSDWFFTKAIGTGPFMHSKFVRDQFWELMPNPKYWNGAPKLDKLINRYFKDEAAAVLALKSGEIQFTYASGDVALQLKKDANFQAFSGPSGVTNYMIFNYRNPIFKDQRVRQAFLYAIDRKAITETVLQGTAQVVPCIGAFSSMYPAADKLNDYAYNPDKAKQLLKDAGAEGKINAEIVTYYNQQFHLDAMAAMQQYLNAVGIKITPKVQDVPTYNGYFYTGKGWDISYRGIGANAGNFPFGFYEVGGQPTEDKAPLMGQEFPELTAMIKQAKTEVNPQKYTDLLKNICTFQNQNAIEGYMWTALRDGIASKKLQNFYWFPGPAGGPYEDHPEKWAVAK